MAKSVLVLCMVLATCRPIPVPNGLDAALSSIANSVVVVSEDAPHSETNSLVQADEPTLQLESANVLPSLAIIALTPEAHNVVAETEELVYSNATDSKGVIKITVVTPTVTTSGEDSSEETTTDGVHQETTPSEHDTEVTTDKTEELTTTTTTTDTITTTAPGVVTVSGSKQEGKEKEEEIKENIKEVEAMPVIFTAGV